MDEMKKDDVLNSAEPLTEKGPRMVTSRMGDNRKERRRKRSIARKAQAKIKRDQRLYEVEVNRDDCDHLRGAAVSYRSQGRSILGIARELDIPETSVRNLLKGKPHVEEEE